MKNFMVIYHAPDDFMEQAAELSWNGQKNVEISWLIWEHLCREASN
jgi:hypothetical protein